MWYQGTALRTAWVGQIPMGPHGVQVNSVTWEDDSNTLLACRLMNSMLEELELSFFQALTPSACKKCALREVTDHLIVAVRSSKACIQLRQTLSEWLLIRQRYLK